ncbi:MAG: hypothetical protein U0X75_01115 [Acidobacteriota bacterium]
MTTWTALCPSLRLRSLVSALPAGQFIQVEKAGEVQLLQLVAQLERILSAIAAA